MKAFIKQIYCGLIKKHIKVSSDIMKGTMCEMHAWCQHCGKSMINK